MSSPISADTHQTYKFYSFEDAAALYEYMHDLLTAAGQGKHTPYAADAFISHATMNRLQLRKCIDATLHSYSSVAVPASIIFWVYRGSTSMNLKCPVELPHICKIPSPAGEQFYVTSKQDWMAHRNATIHKDKPLQIADHAKLQYLERVLGIDVGGLLQNFPIDALNGKGRKLEDGRHEFVVGEFTFIKDGNVCVTVLDNGMVST